MNLLDYMSEQKKRDRIATCFKTPSDYLGRGCGTETYYRKR